MPLPVVLRILFLAIATLATPLASTAAESDAAANRELGMKYYRGEGVKQDNAKARTLLGKAADAGDTEAAFLLGKMYEFGMGTAADEKLSASWYIRGAELGSQLSQFQASIAYYKGEGVARDRTEAAKWWTLAMRCPSYAEMIRPSVQSAEAKLEASEVAEGRKRADDWLASRPSLASQGCAPPTAR